LLDLLRATNVAHSALSSWEDIACRGASFRFPRGTSTINLLIIHLTLWTLMQSIIRWWCNAT